MTAAPAPSTAPASALHGAGPALALGFNAFVWGISWWPLRELQGQGLHPLWATALIYTVAVLVITAWRPRTWGQLWRAPTLWLLVLASGTTNAAFNWGVTVGDVVRVVLLFYLMPLWAALLARLLLKETLSAMAGLRMAIALLGAAIVLWPAGGWQGGLQGGLQSVLPLPRTLPEWLGVLGGFTFALNNVMLRREAHHPEAARALAMFLGGAVVSGVLAGALSWPGTVAWPPAPALGWVLGALALAAAFLASNLALQFGAARLPAHVTAVVMISEVLFASVSAVLLGAGVASPPLLLGGALIVAASLLAVRR